MHTINKYPDSFFDKADDGIRSQPTTGRRAEAGFKRNIHVDGKPWSFDASPHHRWIPGEASIAVT